MSQEATITGSGILPGTLVGRVSPTERTGSVIEDRSMRLSTAIEDLNQAVNDLLRAIQPVLTPEMEEKADGGQKADGRIQGSGVAEYLYHQAIDVQGILERVNSARVRVEL